MLSLASPLLSFPSKHSGMECGTGCATIVTFNRLIGITWIRQQMTPLCVSVSTMYIQWVMGIDGLLNLFATEFDLLLNKMNLLNRRRDLSKNWSFNHTLRDCFYFRWFVCLCVCGSLFSDTQQCWTKTIAAALVCNTCYSCNCLWTTMISRQISFILPIRNVYTLRIQKRGSKSTWCTRSFFFFLFYCNYSWIKYDRWTLFSVNEIHL